MEQKLLFALDALRKGRKKLVDKTIFENHELYRYFFEFENDHDALLLVFEYEKMLFINDIMCGDDSDLSENITNNRILQYAIYNLIQILDKSSISKESKVDIEISSLYNEKIQFLKKIIHIECDAGLVMNKIKYQKYKDDALFKRLVEAMELKNGIHH